MRIYISSTFSDLKVFRQAVYSQLRKSRLDTIAMEDYVAEEKRPLTRCLQDVYDADIYIGIFAWRYGYIPEENNPDKLSITELEYRAAGDYGKERLIFLLRDDTPWSPGLMDTHTKEGNEGEQIIRLRDELRTNHTIGFFASPDELAKEVSAAVSNILLHSVSDLRNPRLDKRRTVQNNQTPENLQSSAIAPGKPLGWYQQGLKIAESIGRIEEIKRSAVATGFIVSGLDLHTDLGSTLFLITPAHVIAKEKEQKMLGFTSEQVNLHLIANSENNEPIKLDKVIWSSPVDELDVSIIQLKQQPEGVAGVSIAKSLPPLNVNRVDNKNINIHSSFISIMGYPLGKELQISFNGCRLLTYDDKELSYIPYSFVDY